MSLLTFLAILGHPSEFCVTMFFDIVLKGPLGFFLGGLGASLGALGGLRGGGTGSSFFATVWAGGPGEG